MKSNRKKATSEGRWVQTIDEDNIVRSSEGTRYYPAGATHEAIVADARRLLTSNKDAE